MGSSMRPTGQKLGEANTNPWHQATDDARLEALCNALKRGIMEREDEMLPAREETLAVVP